MKFDYKQMVDNFGVRYSYNKYPTAAIVSEEFNTQGHCFQYEDTIEKAIDKLKNKIEVERLEEIQRLEDMKTKFNNLPFFEKIEWQLKNKKLNFNSTSEERKKDFNSITKNILKSIEISRINKNIIYTVLSPHIIKEDDVLYVVVTDSNVLGIGIYKATVTRGNYMMRNKESVALDGTLSITYNGEEKEFTFNGSEQNFESRHAYHNIFTNKERAINYHNVNVSKKMKEMEQQIVNLDMNLNIVTNNKPKL